MSQTPTPVHKTSTLTINDTLTIEERLALYPLDGRRVDVSSTDGTELTGTDGDGLAFIGETYEYLIAERAPTSRADSAWFECPVTGEWLPVSRGVRYRGTLYSPDAAADLAVDAVNKKSAPTAPVHWSDNGSVRP